MKGKHTQGKWEIIDDSDLRLSHGGGSIRIGIKGGNRDWLADAKGSHVNNKMKANEWEANAKLIAAAPEMLDALNQINIKLGDIEGTRDLTSTEHDIIELVKSAINKATL